MVAIDDDVSGVAAGLHAIDHHLRLRYSEAGGYFVVYWKPDGEATAEEGGGGYLVTTAQECDQRIVKRVQEVYYRCTRPGYSLAEEIDKQDAKAKKAASDAWSERHGEMFERMAFAMRHDLGYDQHRIYVPKGVAA